MKKSIVYFLVFLSLQFPFLGGFSQNIDSIKNVNIGAQLLQKGIDFYSTNFDSSAFYVSQASSIFFNDSSWEDYLDARLVLNAINFNKGDFLAVRENAESDFHISKTKLPNNYEWIALTTNNLAVAYSKFGDFSNSLNLYREAYLLLNKNEENCIQELRYLFALAVINSKIGDYSECKKILNKGIQELLNCQAYQEQNKSNDQQIFLHDFYYELAVVNKKLGIFKEANTHFQQALYFFSEQPSTPSIEQKIKSCQYEYLGSLILCDSFEKAERFVQSITIHPEDDILIHRPQVYFQLKGKLAKEKGEYSKALEHFQHAYTKRLAYFRQRKNHYKLSSSLIDLGEIYVSLDDLDQAISSYNSAFAILYKEKILSTPYPLLVVPVLDGKAQAHLARYERDGLQTDLDTSLWCFLVADSLVDQARDRLQNEGSKLFFSQKSRPIYERAIAFCMKMHNTTGEERFLEQAFYFSERNKATLLFQSLQDEGAKLAAGLPDSLLEMERDLKVDIAFYQNKIFEAGKKASAEDNAQLMDWRQILFDREETYRELVKRLEKEFPAYFNLKYNHEITDVGEVQKQLLEGQLFLEFFVGDQAIYAFSIDPKGLRVYELARDSQTDRRLADLLANIRQQQTGLAGLKGFANPAYTLFQRFVAPCITDRQVDQLIVVPDGQLSYLPFELLLDTELQVNDLSDRQADRAYRKLPYLFQRMSLRYAYSATIVFANPYRPKAPINQVVAFAPAYTDRWFLAHNQPQAKAVADLTGGKAFTAGDASKEQFMTLAPNYSILHLAMHGEPDLYSPLRAKLRFAGEDSAASSSLYAYELYNMKLNAKMAVLAACESGYGKLEKSEGMYSLARAFRYAGCPSVVSSLWKADGEATIELMKAFYAQLEEGKSKAKALQVARKQYIENASNAQLHPYYWANFVVIGDNEPVAIDWPWAWVVGIIGISMLLLVLYLRKKRLK